MDIAFRMIPCYQGANRHGGGDYSGIDSGSQGTVGADYMSGFSKV